MEVLLQLLLLAIGFAMLVKGADWFVDGASGIATKFKIPQLVIGLTIVAMGTSAPEAAVSISAALGGNADITVGNIVGSNIYNALFILGMVALFTPVLFPTDLTNDVYILIATTLLLIFSAFLGKIGRISGIIYLIAYGFYVSYLIG